MFYSFQQQNLTLWNSAVHSADSPNFSDTWNCSDIVRIIVRVLLSHNEHHHSRRVTKDVDDHVNCVECSFDSWDNAVVPQHQCRRWCSWQCGWCTHHARDFDIVNGRVSNGGPRVEQTVSIARRWADFETMLADNVVDRHVNVQLCTVRTIWLWSSVLP